VLPGPGDTQACLQDDIAAEALRRHQQVARFTIRLARQMQAAILEGRVIGVVHAMHLISFVCKNIAQPGLRAFVAGLVSIRYQDTAVGQLTREWPVAREWERTRPRPGLTTIFRKGDVGWISAVVVLTQNAG